MRKILLLLSSLVVALCLVIAGFFYWRISPPGSSFPQKVFGLMRVAGPEYRKDETYPGVYAAVYSSGLENLPGKSEQYIYMPGAYLHTVYLAGSEEEAKNLVRKNREFWQKEAERDKQRNQNEARKSTFKESGIFIAPEDSPENDYLVYVANDQANVQWVSGNWFCTVSAAAEPDPELENFFSAERVFNFARSLKYAPKGTTPPAADDYLSFTIYDFIKYDLPLWLRYWYPVAIPLVVSLPFVLTAFLALFWRRRKPLAAA